MSRLPYKIPYHRRATNKVMPVGMNYLSDLVVRPGMRKRLWPLCLYRGNMSPGHAHRFWNIALLMMAAECETLSDGLKVIHNPAFAQLCGPVRTPSKVTLNSFFGRLWDSPDVSDNIPGLTEYVRSLELGRSGLIPVELETPEQFCAPWRVSLHEDFDKHAEKPESGVRNLYYPYIAHDPKRQDDGREIVLLVNKMVPAYLPDQVRADACQDLVVGLLSGEIEAGKAHGWVEKYVRHIYQQYPHFFDHGRRTISFNQPVPGTSGDGPGQLWTEIV